ncbi:XRE family transcriptional regulator [Bacillus sp. FJAT-27916]|uniref:helix-turn-helix domain-containing protein n=1 Tax=Bacillaceae TaxID=186817 RepID=UPI000670951F|nr:helix-turn-helix transcriptional regulator [Bacillus sp. FJAT-27916]KMY43327.1 XRE family transcriptional regulator [Bacillus sp. FJAT-27916]
MSIGENIRKHRLEKGLSQEELAMRSRIGTQKLEKFEANELIPNLQVILNLSSALECPASELIEQITPTGPCDIDDELQSLIQEMGQKKAKLILRKTKDIEEKDFLHVMQMLFDVKYEQTK